MTAPVTAQPDFGMRTHSIYDLEATLVKFITDIVDPYRLDNPTLNLAQATAPEPRIVRGPDEPPVSYDYTERAQTLALKRPPRVSRGRVPRTVTGEIAVDKLPDYPSITVQAVAAQVRVDVTVVTARIFVHAYDENPDSGGYQDCLNIVEALAIALGSFGQAAIDQAYPIILPIDWNLVENDTFPHYIAELTTMWELPSPRPMPDPDKFPIIPTEHFHFETENLPRE
jgi:hypothetical protein